MLALRRLVASRLNVLLREQWAVPPPQSNLLRLSDFGDRSLRRCVVAAVPAFASLVPQPGPPLVRMCLPRCLPEAWSEGLQVRQHRPSAVTDFYCGRHQRVWDEPSSEAKDLPSELLSVFERRCAMVDLLGFEISDYLMFDFKAYLSAVTRARIPL